MRPTSTSVPTDSRYDAAKKTGLDAGVGIGVGVRVFATTGIAVALVMQRLRRRRTRKDQKQCQDEHDGMTMPELSREHLAELEDDKKYHKTPDYHSSTCTYGLNKPESDGTGTRNGATNTMSHKEPAVSMPTARDGSGQVLGFIFL